MEAIIELFTSGDIWAIVIKVLVTAIFTAIVGLICTLIGKLIAKSKNSKVKQYAKTCVKAAEIKFPNEGKKMGPEKMQYVMDQMMIKFPKIRDNQYLYNIAEAAVFELNKQMQQEAAIKEFEEKYGEEPIAIQKEVDEDVKITEVKDDLIENISNGVSSIVEETIDTSNIEKENTTNDSSGDIPTPQQNVKKQDKIKIF